ncbi:MAG: imidazoleglycerol-phosphate dehydratase HisB [Clostridia bacterium]|jgi:imidazoleglycerol-phosphate dehydratase|nr:imidazoleglycerol-phosphate dehydratase HisB [Clostridia bacterium]
MRQAEIRRTTGETDITVRLDLDGTGKNEIHTGVGFLDHMLELFSRHGRFDLAVTCVGDIRVDDHHSTEDIGIALGQAFDRALGDKKGIRRYGSMILPMDESLILSAVDLSGRGLLAYGLQIPTAKVGTFDTELAEEFFEAFARNARCTLHLRQLSGKNSHHIIEGAFKSVARSLREAVSIDPACAGEIPSTKGVL